jgi:hypothetical protein
LTDYLTSPPNEMDMEEEDGDEGYEGMAEAGENVPSFIEGARVNSDLYDAYNAHGWSAHPMASSISRRSHANFSAVLAPTSDAEVSNPPASAHPPFESRTRNSTWTLPGSTTFMSGSSPTLTPLTRQPSIRRSVRSRTVDFHGFSSRRRSTFRNTAADTDDPRSSEDIPGTLDSWMPGPISDEPLGSPGARRFFPLSRRRHEMAVSSMPAWSDGEAIPIRPVSPPEPIAFRPLRYNFGPPPLVPAISFEEHERSLSDESQRPQLPRLRRGGLRAPESMLSRHASPITGETDESPPSIVISISREAQSDPAEAPTTTPEVAEQTLSSTGL